MSTPASKKKRNLVLAVIAITGVSYIGANVGFIELSRWAERELNCFPYRSEDWLRYQLPTCFARNNVDTILLCGPSATRENFLLHLFREANPKSEILTGALSQGTLEDIALGVEYLEQTLAPDHLPKTIVLGMTPRCVLGISHDVPPFQSSLESYSAYFRVAHENGRSTLVKKDAWESARGRWNFWFKQTHRYRATFIGIVAHLLGQDDESELFFHREEMEAMWASIQFQSARFPHAIRFIQDVGLFKSVGLWARLYTTPYKYHHLRPRSLETIRRWTTEPDSNWTVTQNLNPQDREQYTTELFARIMAIVDRHKMQLFIVFLPEHPMNLERYTPGYYQRCVDIVRSCVGATAVFDLHELLAEDEFYDVVHATPAGATKITNQVLRLMQQAQTGAAK